MKLMKWFLIAMVLSACETIDGPITQRAWKQFFLEQPGIEQDKMAQACFDEVRNSWIAQFAPPESKQRSLKCKWLNEVWATWDQKGKLLDAVKNLPVEERVVSYEMCQTRRNRLCEGLLLSIDDWDEKKKLIDYADRLGFNKRMAIAERCINGWKGYDCYAVDFYLKKQRKD